MLTRDMVRWAEPLEGPLPKRHAVEAQVGGGGYDWLLLRGETGDQFAIEALRRALYTHNKRVHVIKWGD